MRRSPSRAGGAPRVGPDRAAIDERRLRSVEEPLDVRLRTDRPYPILEVRNPMHRTAYLVMLPEFPSRESALCTCQDFARRGLGTCKHLEAGFRWLRERPDARPLLPPRRGRPRLDAVWREVERRQRAPVDPKEPESSRLRRPGEALFEAVGTRRS